MGLHHQWQNIAMAMGSFARNKQTNNNRPLPFQQEVREFSVLTSPKPVLLDVFGGEKVAYPTYASPTNPAPFSVVQLDHFQSKK